MGENLIPNIMLLVFLALLTALAWIAVIILQHKSKKGEMLNKANEQVGKILNEAQKSAEDLIAQAQKEAAKIMLKAEYKINSRTEKANEQIKEYKNNIENLIAVRQKLQNDISLIKTQYEEILEQLEIASADNIEYTEITSSDIDDEEFNDNSNINEYNQDDFEDKPAFNDAFLFFSEYRNQILLYDIRKMKFFTHGFREIFMGKVEADYYFISPIYQNKIESYLLIINIMLDEITTKYDLPQMIFNPQKLKYERDNEYINDFCRFCYHPYTYLGKENNTPFSIILRFDGDISCVDLYLDECYNLVGSHIVYWLQKQCYSFSARPYKGLFQIISAYKKGEQKERIFDILYENYLKRKFEYEWISVNLPKFAPLSLGGYTKMKNSNSKNYQKLKALATEQGFELEDGI